MKKLWILSAAFFLVGCASSFKKADKVGDTGYSVRELSTNTHFEVTATLNDPGAPNRYIGLYLLRAIGEECAARGFPFFNFDNSGPNRMTVTGFCYKTPVRKILGLVFGTPAPAGQTERTTHIPLILLETPTKAGSILKAGDTITHIENEPVANMEELVRKVFLLSEQGLTEVSLQYKRDGKSLTTKEKLVEVSEKNISKNFDAEYLEYLRSGV